MSGLANAAGKTQGIGVDDLWQAMAFAAVEDAGESGLAGKGVGDGFLVGAEIGGR
jgi:hypothetical protein